MQAIASSDSTLATADAERPFECCPLRVIEIDI
jgi:hypothetical protein